MKLRIGTRGSKLALAQTGEMAALLRARGHETEITVIETAGDADRTSRFEEVGPAGVFVRELQAALLEARVDVAVHSYKDLPSDVPDGLVVAAVPERENPCDCLLVRASVLAAGGRNLPLPSGARVGTASARRDALLRELRPDLEVLHLRGNVTTRVRRLSEGDYDAILLASAGLIRLQRAHPELLPAGIHQQDLDARLFVPAPSQGALALETRADDAAVLDAVSALDEATGRRTVAAERELLALMQAGCQTAFGAWCEADAGGGLTLHAVLGTSGGLRRTRVQADAPGQVAQLAYRGLLAAVEETS